jgi:hypothetical protein
VITVAGWKAQGRAWRGGRIVPGEWSVQKRSFGEYRIDLWERGGHWYYAVGLMREPGPAAPDPSSGEFTSEDEALDAAVLHLVALKRDARPKSRQDG